MIASRLALANHCAPKKKTHALLPRVLDLELPDGGGLKAGGTESFFWFQAGYARSLGRRQTGLIKSRSRTTRRRSCSLLTYSTRGSGGKLESDT